MNNLSVKSYFLKAGTCLKSGTNYELTVIQEKVICTRMTGLLFETDKTFLLPGAIPNIRACVDIFKQYVDGEILIVGHADAAGKNTYNRDLSVKRALMVEAYLKDDAKTWLNNYKPSSVGDVWGIREDQLMLQSLAQKGVPFYQGIINGTKDLETKKAIKEFQNFLKITPNGELDDAARLALIQGYMAEDETSISGKTVTMVHGCGEEHPVIKTADGEANEKNRRVEIYLFQNKIEPQPALCKIPGGCKEYSQWVNQVTETIDLGDEAPDFIDDFTVKPRTLSRPRKEEHVVTTKNGQRNAVMTFYHLPTIKC